MSSRCRICQGGALESLTVPERHFGTGKSFDYQLCGACHSLQIAEIPADLSEFYPKGYYSLQSGWEAKMASPLRRLAKRLRDGFELTGKGFFGNILASKSRYPEMASLRRVEPAKDWRLLDVGCGDGFMLWSLANLGFKNLSGADPNLGADKNWPGVQLLKKELKDLGGEFELVMFHHSLEHVESPAKALAQAARLLAPHGRVLVRVPTSDCEAFERYREFWIQIDAPRHLHLMSRGALKKLGEDAGLRLLSSWDDSNAFQFWGSEQARQGLSLNQGGRERFSEAQLSAWEAESQKLNSEGRGDSIAMLFQRQA